jgi:hypothetical protein
MIEFIERNGHRWTPPPGDEDGEISAQVILDVAAGPVNDQIIGWLARWIRERAEITE